MYVYINKTKKVRKFELTLFSSECFFRKIILSNYCFLISNKYDQQLPIRFLLNFSIYTVSKKVIQPKGGWDTVTEQELLELVFSFLFGIQILNYY